jgi:hypothetical protein
MTERSLHIKAISWFLSLLLIILMPMLLAACGDDDGTSSGTTGDVQDSDKYLHESYIVVDGRTLTCVSNDYREGGGLSCNWEAWNR